MKVKKKGREQRGGEGIGRKGKEAGGGRREGFNLAQGHARDKAVIRT